MHEFLQMRRDRKCGVERDVGARVVKKTARLSCFWAVRKGVQLLFDNAFWFNIGVLPWKVFHILNKFSTIPPADVVAVKKVFHVKH